MKEEARKLLEKGKRAAHAAETLSVKATTNSRPVGPIMRCCTRPRLCFGSRICAIGNTRASMQPSASTLPNPAGSIPNITAGCSMLLMIGFGATTTPMSCSIARRLSNGWIRPGNSSRRPVASWRKHRDR